MPVDLGLIGGNCIKEEVLMLELFGDGSVGSLGRRVRVPVGFDVVLLWFTLSAKDWLLARAMEGMSFWVSLSVEEADA